MPLLTFLTIFSFYLIIFTLSFLLTILRQIHLLFLRNISFLKMTSSNMSKNFLSFEGFRFKSFES